MKKAFTLVEMLVTIFIISLIAAASIASVGAIKKNTSSSTGADEIRTLFYDLRSIAAGADRSNITHYILVLNPTSGDVRACNKDVTTNFNILKKNQYIICSSASSTIPANIDTDFNRVRADRLVSDVEITPATAPIIYSVRVFDGQIGYFDTSANKFLYPEDTGFSKDERSIMITKSDLSKAVVISPFLGLIKMPSPSPSI